ncbi:hypothetical protein [Streptomyces sp. V4I8]|uniref:hypothetical protein n=1 Tax=Streptomyces sp. V4I8 TaxID=3156469 RepID=UPI003518410F
MRTRTHCRLLYLWGRTGYRVWLLPPSPAVDFEPERRVPDAAQQVVLLADADGEPTTAVLRFRGGHVLVHRLGRSRPHPPLTRRQRRSLYTWEIEQWQERSGWLTGEHPVAIAPQGPGTRVTTCAAPAGLPMESLLLGYADGSRRGVRRSRRDTDGSGDHGP